jgi:hypothetical protein
MVGYACLRRSLISSELSQLCVSRNERDMRRILDLLFIRLCAAHSALMQGFHCSHPACAVRTAQWIARNTYDRDFSYTLRGTCWPRPTNKRHGWSNRAVYTGRLASLLSPHDNTSIGKIAGYQWARPAARRRLDARLWLPRVARPDASNRFAREISIATVQSDMIYSVDDTDTEVPTALHNSRRQEVMDRSTRVPGTHNQAAA